MKLGMRLSGLDRLIEFWKRRTALGASKFSETLICQLSKNSCYCIPSVPAPISLATKAIRVGSVQETEQLLSELPGKTCILAVLPKSQYIIRRLEFPNVSVERCSAMMRLEVEASLPAEFGPAEISYRLLEGQNDAPKITCEVYVARRKAVEDFLDKLRSFGLYPDFIMPSAVAWHEFLRDPECADMCVAASSESGSAEVAFVENSDTTAVRFLDSVSADNRLAVHRGLRECMRSLLKGAPASSAPLTIGWIGEGCPPCDTNTPYVFRKLGDGNVKQSSVGSERDTNASLAFVAASAMSNSHDNKWSLTANLLPRGILIERSNVLLIRHLLMGIAGIVSGLVLASFALHVLIVRYENLDQHLSEKISLIQVEGEVAGLRIAQLKAMDEVMATRDDLYLVVSGLYANTPPGITYSNVEFTDEGQIRVQGQAESVSLPFILSEKLQNSRLFDRAAIGNVGQRKKGSGSTTEFWLKCILNRQGAL